MTLNVVSTTGVGEISPLIDSFERHLRAENKARKTIITYRQATDGFVAFLAQRGMPLAAGPAESHAVERDCAATSRCGCFGLERFRHDTHRELLIRLRRRVARRWTAIDRQGVNLVKNPGFQVNLSGWTVSPARTGCTLGRARVGLRGTWGAVVQNMITKRQSCGLDDSPNWVNKSSAGVYTAKIWVRGGKAGTPVTLLLSEYHGRTRVGYAYKRITLKTTWQLLTVSYRIKHPGSVLSMNTSVCQGKGVDFCADDISITYI